MPAQERLHVIGLQRADAVTRRLGREGRELRLRIGLSQSDLARVVGCTTNRWSNEPAAGGPQLTSHAGAADGTDGRG